MYVTDYPDGSYHAKVERALTHLFFSMSDISIGGIPLIEETVMYGKPSVPYFALKISWFVPCPKPFSRLQRISHIFSPSVRVAIVVVLLVVTVASWCLAKQSNNIWSYTTMSRSVYNI